MVKVIFVLRLFKMAKKRARIQLFAHALFNVQNNVFTKGCVSLLYTIRSAHGLEQDQDIEGAVQNRNCWIKTSHIDYTTYFQLYK